MTKEEAINLLQRYREGLCSYEEKQTVENWYASLEAKGKWEWTDEEKVLFGDDMLGRILAEINEHGEGKVVPMPNRTSWLKIAAAVLLLGVTTFTWILLSAPQEEEKQVAGTVAAAQDTNDAQPGKTGAILTLANGQKILLDTTADGAIAVQGGPTIVNKDGTLTYDDTRVSDVAAYNSIVTPKGRQYKLILSDGTKVWLNAASSLHYPVYFGGDQRRVEVSGEAYFEVAEKKNQRGQKLPFTVKVLHENKSSAEVEVLGTHFNINAYDDEADTRVTLLEGAVKVSKANEAPVLIHPGQQAKIRDKILVDNNADLEMVMAWKNGAFNFKNSDVSTVMRQAERWYDIKVAYPVGIPPDTLNGGISRDVKLSEFLDIIRYSDIRATVHNGVVEIKPAATGKK